MTVSVLMFSLILYCIVKYSICAYSCGCMQVNVDVDASVDIRCPFERETFIGTRCH